MSTENDSVRLEICKSCSRHGRFKFPDGKVSLDFVTKASALFFLLFNIERLQHFFTPPQLQALIDEIEGSPLPEDAEDFDRREREVATLN